MYAVSADEQRSLNDRGRVNKFSGACASFLMCCSLPVPALSLSLSLYTKKLRLSSPFHPFRSPPRAEVKEDEVGALGEAGVVLGPRRAAELGGPIPEPSICISTQFFSGAARAQ